MGFGNLDVGNSARILLGFLFCCCEISSAWGTGGFYWGRNFVFPIKKLDEKRMFGCM